MPLTSGTKLGPYEIQSPLGAGGMGEVYRARDTRLNRTVAVKILPAHLSANPEARQRFEREARTISSLNHANICMLHDIGNQDGTDFLVMEFVEGETLEARLQRGPLPLNQALDCALQICDALEKAHRAGIVHRDLKPGNIMLTPSGAKLLDFGLAKPGTAFVSAHVTEQGAHTPSTPTINISALSAAPAAALTQQGTIVGTFQYMAPEIAQGREADARSDIFSFGCVLYEMVTGRRAFEGKSQLSVLTAIIEKDPEPLSTLSPASPPALDYTVQACLEKNPDNRVQAAHDVKLQLAWIAKSKSQTSAAAIPVRKRTSKIWVIATCIALLAVVGLIAALLFRSAPPARVFRTNLLPPPATIFQTMYRNGAPALSPDGARIVFVAGKDGKNSLWVRSLDKLDATALRGTDDAFFPFWSPDGNTIAFFMHGKLWRMEIPGGSPSPICDAPEGRGGSWGRANVIIFAPFTSGPLAQVSADGGAAKVIPSAVPSNGFASYRWPSFLPDGKHYLTIYSPIGDADARNEVRFGSIEDGKEQLLMRGRFYTVHYADGWLLAVRDGSLFAWKFDPAGGKISGEGRQLLDKVATDDITATAAFSVSSQGELLYQVGSSGTGDRHLWLDANGKQLAQISEPGVFGATRLSPDGTRIVTPVLESSGEQRPWVWDIAGGTRARVSTASNNMDVVTWSADGRTIYYNVFDDKGHLFIRSVPADGSQPEHDLLNTADDTSPADVTSDGKWLLYDDSAANVGASLKALPLVPGLTGFTVLDSVKFDSNARLRPGANDWLAYQSFQDGRSDIFVTRFPHPGAKYQVTPSAGTQPVWSADGKTLYYLDGSQKLVAVGLTFAGDSVQISPPKTLFPTGIRHSIPSDAYDVSRDGRFLVINSVNETDAPIVLVTNWPSDLKK